jgi:copper chaperone
MTTFDVQDMTCGHCTNAITQAVLALDPAAKVQIDQPSHRVQIESASAEADLIQAIEKAGYSPVATTSEPASSEPIKKTKGGCCCK